MKTIIKGKKYDTETASLIAEGGWWDSSVNYSQTEFLFQKKNGEFFRYDEKRTTYGNIQNYQEIVPFSLEEAKDWGEKYMTTEKYELVFGIVEE